MKKYFKFIAIAVCMVLASSLLFACACNTKSLAYSGAALASGKVGMAYSQSVATATGADSISYALKTGSSLPAGLALSEAGTVSGTPSAKTDGEITFTVVADAEGYESAEAQFKLTIGEGTFVYNGGSLTAYVGAQFNESVKTVTEVNSVTYTHKSGTVPAGITFDNGVFSGTPTAVTAAAAAITVTASAAEYASADAVYSITVTKGGLSYTGAALKTAYLGEEYAGDTTATATSATGETIKYDLADSLPLGLSFDNGVIGGTPEEAGYKTFNVTASAANYNDKTAAFTIAIVGSSVVYEGSALPDGEVGSAYSASVATAAGKGTITYELTSESALPDGLSLSKAGLISGTPKATANNHKFTVAASDSVAGMDPAEAEFSITIDVSADHIIAGLSVGGDCFQVIPDVKGMEGAASITYALKAGSSLPEGLSLSSKGVLYGMPLETAGKAEFTVVASAEGYDNAEDIFGVTITEGEFDFSGSNTLTQARLNDVYYELLRVSAPTAVQYTYSLLAGSTLPVGLELRNDGLINGTPTVLTGSAGVEFTVTASAQGCKTVEKTFSIKVTTEITETGGSIRNFNAKTVPDAYAEEAYYASGAVKATNTQTTVQTNLSFALKADSTLPEGFELLPNGDLRSVNLIPSAATGQYTFTVVASAKGCASSVEAVMTLNINDPKVVARDFDIDAPTVGTAYSVSIDMAIAHDETAIYTLINTLPDGFTLKNGILSGTAVKSVKEFNVQVNVSAPNHSTVAMTVSSNIWDAVTEVPGGKFEAEYMNLRGKKGAGESNEPSDEGLIQSQEGFEGATVSNGYFVGYTHKPIFFTFEFNCSKTVPNATLQFCLGSEKGVVTLDASNTVIRVNGAAIGFNTITVEVGATQFSVFKAYTFTNNLALATGANTIEIEYLGSGANPAIDYMQISNYGDAVLSWAPHLYNLDSFGG